MLVRLIAAIFLLVFGITITYAETWESSGKQKPDGEQPYVVLDYCNEKDANNIKKCVTTYSDGYKYMYFRKDGKVCHHYPISDDTPFQQE